jgi:negative regulator of sigma E activity
MNEHSRVSLEDRSRALFDDSVDSLDMRMRSRLTQARHAALEAAAMRESRPWLFRAFIWTPAAGVTAAAVLGVALWFGSPLGHHMVTANDNQPNLEDLEIVASSDDGNSDAMDMLQDDIDFYDWAEKAANPGPAA